MTRYCAAVDIGGTKIKSGIVDERGRVWAQRSAPTPTGEGAGAQAADGMILAIRAMCEELSVPMESLEGIGLVCAGPVNQLTQTIENPYTLPGWEGFALPAYLEAKSGLPTRMQHDVNGALIGEVFLRGCSGTRVMMISLGTGIGVAVYDGDHPFSAGRCYHPEMGHVVVDPGEKTECYCRRSGCFESLCAGPALHAAARRHGKRDFQAMYDAWKGGEEALAQPMAEIARHFCDGVWNLCVIFKPDVLILGGGLMKQYYDECRDLLVPMFAAVPDFIEEIRIECANFENDSALVGASRLVLGM